jgi:uncharacterized membrane protein SpoIIM required for sporulation
MKPDDRALEHWLERRTDEWRRLVTLSTELGRGRARTPADAVALAEGYRSVARDVSLARRVMPQGRTRAGLETLYANLHSLLYRPAHHWWYDLRELLGDAVPRVMAELRPQLVWVVALFVASTAAGAWLVSTFPELVGLIASDEMIEEVESGELWTDGILNVTPSSVLSIGILANNIAVTTFAFVAGIFFGLGTFYVIALNGLMLGAIFAFTAEHDLAMRLFAFVVAHGVVELSVICVAGAAGFGIGEALVRPGSRTRREAFQRASLRIGTLLVPCGLLLIGCGFIEGYVSPNAAFPLESRIVIGLAYGVLMAALLGGKLVPSRQTRRSRRSLE